MSSYTLTKAAENDLARIAAYTVENFGAEQALAYRDELIRTLQVLAENPAAARLRTELNPPVRVHPHKAHLIIYIEQGESILIVRIRHGRENWAAEHAQD